MTWLPDHRATHGPDSDCDACRPPEPALRAAAVPRLDARGISSLRPDLVIEPGTNRK
jgi:hypothetical protein